MSRINKQVNYKFTNSDVITPGSLWYPFTESNAPTDQEIDMYFPLRSSSIENHSTQQIIFILDPVAGESTKEYTISNGQGMNIKNEDLITFHQIAIKNNGALDIQANEIKILVRNY